MQTGFDSCDVLLEPDLSRFSPADVFGGAEMFDIGYDCAYTYIYLNLQRPNAAPEKKRRFYKR